MSEYLIGNTSEEFRLVMAESFLLVCSQASKEELSINSNRTSFRNLVKNLFSLVPESIDKIDLGNIVLIREVDGEKAKAWGRDDLEAYFKTRRRNNTLFVRRNG